MMHFKTSPSSFRDGHQESTKSLEYIKSGGEIKVNITENIDELKMKIWF